MTELRNTQVVGIDEARNIDRLGTYAFAYALLAVAVGSGLLAILVMLHLPTDGRFGAVPIVRLFFRLVALVNLALGIYAFYCYRHGATRLRAGIRLCLIALLFFLLGMEYRDVTPALLHALAWIGTDCGSLCGVDRIF